MEQDGAELDAARVIAVDDEAEPLKVVSRALSGARFQVQAFNRAREVLEELDRRGSDVDIVLTDIYMPEMTGMDLLSAVREQWPHIAVIVMTGASDIATAVEAMKKGAYDYLVKPVDPIETLLPAVTRAAERVALVRRNTYLERQVNLAARFEGLVGESRPMREIFSLVESVAPTDSTVLILGESGTGKELVARAIHERSTRAGRPFVAINCGALAENVLESELFGHVRGAFTGAASNRRGLFEEASGGTLFLDEVGELPPSMQVKLLRVLQEGTVRPVGSNEPRRVNVRVLAATNRDLDEEVAAGRFREDLFYRLNVINIDVPSLDERLEDIPELAIHFLRKHAARLGKSVTSIAPDAIEHLTSRRWPGNVRELENALERAVVLARDETITPDLLPRPVQTTNPDNKVPTMEMTMPFGEAKTLFEKRYLEHALSAAGGNIAEAARTAGVDRSNFRRLMKRHGLDARAPRGEDR